jgi:hypothetical protein
MPYIAMDNNRYLGEHSCGLYHYGDHTMVRKCCVEDCAKYAQLAMKNALTPYHPAYQIYKAAWGQLTDAEQKLAPRLTYAINTGFTEVK